MAEDRSPLEAALDVVLYAPVGLVITATEQLPELAEKGRSKVASQLTAARLVGRFAVKQGRRELARRGKETLGSFAERQNLAGADAAHEPSPAGDSAESAAAAEPAPLSARGARDGTSDQAVPVEDAHLAIPGYDSLSASQVVSRLGGLTSEELAEVAEYEASHRGRRTVMNRVRQLQG
jgi:hypothetical protein